MRGVSEMVPLARQFPGIVQIAQALPIGFIKVCKPLMAKFSEFERVSSRTQFDSKKYSRDTALLSKNERRH